MKPGKREDKTRLQSVYVLCQPAVKLGSKEENEKMVYEATSEITEQHSTESADCLLGKYKEEK
jgi:hypothetical protein